jgi:5'-nucleotidase
MHSTTRTAPIVLVDMDGVLADFDRVVLDGLPPEVARIERANFYIAEDYPAHHEHIVAVTSHPDFFHRLPPIAGAIDGWERLLALGFAPRICTAPLTRNARAREGKLAWLEEHLVPRFGHQVVDEAIVDKRKYLYPGLALIDDRPDVDTNNGEATWQHIIFDYPYNQTSDVELRLYGWSDPDLPDLLKRASAGA